MDIVLLDYYLRLFAILANIFPRLVIDDIKEFLKSSVFNELNQEIRLEGFKLFNEYHIQYSSATKESNTQDLIQTLSQIDIEIPQRQKFQILLRVLIFKKAVFKEEKDSEFNSLVESISQVLNINNEDYNNCKVFIAEKFYNVENISNLLIISENGNYPPEMPTLKRKNLPGQIFFLSVENPKTILFIYKGNQTITYNKQIIKSSTVYFFNRGSYIKGENIETIYYNQVFQKFKIKEKVPLRLDVRELEFRYKNSSHGIHKLNLNLESEQLIGIIGRSGVGKSTLINLLIGNKKPDEGSITINGIELDQNNEELDGLIGYVSQDDLLLEDLTVFTNLMLNARLCLGNLPNEIVEEKVNNLLTELDLFDVKDLQVGSPLHRLISGGQRKKLNIALELIREPWILFADEPTSGLSSSDSEEIMQLLSEQTSKGKIVVVNIHQPSSDVFKLFDKIIVLDREGYPVYFGNPIDAIPYFNDYFQKIYINADICEVCENVNPEAIFKVIEEKKINEFGEFIKRRKTTPYEWHQHFLRQNPPPDKHKQIVGLPEIQFSKPGPLKQFLIFSKRNFLSKLANTQYILLAVIISPALAVVLSSLCRYNNINESATEYFYAYNENIPSYFFMSIIVALFLGLIMSAEEIIRDRKIVMRESYLRLSKLSYINSKTAFVFGVSAMQTLLYVLIGNAILGIESMDMSFWLIMFSTSCFANILGLLISSLFNSVIAVYIMVPLIIVPQMLLSGVVVNYDKINKYLSSSEFVPFVGDVMASRWAYEAMAVKEFGSNDYQKHYFKVEQEESNVKFNLLFVIPELKKAVAAIEKKNGNIANHLRFIRNESIKLQYLPIAIQSHPTNPKELKNLKKQLDKVNDYLSDRLNILATQKDSITRALIGKLGSTELYLACKSDNYNNSLADLVLKRKELEPYAIVNNKIIRQMEPIYQVPNSNYGRAQFLSAKKKMGQFTINAFSFNILVIWVMTITTYVILVFVSGTLHSKKMLKLMNGKHSN